MYPSLSDPSVSRQKVVEVGGRVKEAPVALVPVNSGAPHAGGSSMVGRSSTRIPHKSTRSHRQVELVLQTDNRFRAPPQVK